MKTIMATLFALTSLFPLVLQAESAQHRSPYAGEENRIIKSLSADDLAQLEAGKGWGLAKAAELNGLPGPVHLLEMKKEIGLSAEQEAQITRLYETMKREAMVLGRQLITQERELDQAFANKSIDPAELRRRLNEIAETRASLRYVHLSAHLETPALLTKEQVSRYNTLRGYDGDPCQNVPAGHDARMWREHNDCS